MISNSQFLGVFALRYDPIAEVKVFSDCQKWLYD